MLTLKRVLSSLFLPTATVAVAALTFLFLSCYQSAQSADAVTAISFEKDGGKTTLGSVHTERTTRVGTLNKTTTETAELRYKSAEHKLFLHGKPVEHDALEAWAATTVECELTTVGDKLYFSGGKPAFSTPYQSGKIITASPGGCSGPSCPTYQPATGCPGGNCPVPSGRQPMPRNAWNGFGFWK